MNLDFWRRPGGTADESVGLRSTTAVRTCRALALSVEERAERKRAVRL